MLKSLILFLFFAYQLPSAKAASLCSKITKECNPKSAVERFSVFQCESSKVAYNCAEFYAKNPKVAEKDCKSLVVCSPLVKVADYAGSCAMGAVDSVVDLARGVVAFVAADTQMLPEMAEREEYFRTCITPECKREMLGPYVGLFSKEEIEGHPNDKNLDPKDPTNQTYLQGLSSKTLYRKLLPMLKKKLDNQTLSEPFIEPWSNKPVDLEKVKTMDELIAGMLEKAGVHNTECYPPEVLAEMRCYALTVLLDPFTMAKGLAAIRKVAGVVDSVAYDTMVAIKAVGKTAPTSAEIIAKYPKVAEKVKDANAVVNKMNLDKPVKYLEDVDWEEYTGNFLTADAKEVIPKKLKTMDPQIKATVHGVLNKMNDTKEFSLYMEKLQADTILEIEKKGIAKELDGLQNGEVSANAAMRVLVKRAQERGRGNFSMIVNSTEGKITKSRKPNDSNAAFREAIAQGAFFDKAYKNGTHGMTSHMLQQDYVADVVSSSMKGKPQKFWDYMGSKEGVTFWMPLFDSGKNATFASPEFTKWTVRRYMPLK